MRVKADASDALLADTLAAIAQGRADATLRVLECKAAAGETASEVLDLAMRVCGGAAFRKDVGVERFFRDARAGASWLRRQMRCMTLSAGQFAECRCFKRGASL